MSKVTATIAGLRPSVGASSVTGDDGGISTGKGTTRYQLYLRNISAVRVALTEATCHAGAPQLLSVGQSECSNKEADRSGALQSCEVMNPRPQPAVSSRLIGVGLHAQGRKGVLCRCSTKGGSWATEAFTD